MNSILKFIFIIGLLFVDSRLLAQNVIVSESSRITGTPKLFLNCTRIRCYDEFLKPELSFFDFVRDMSQADIQIMFQNQTTGAGGKTYYVYFLGQNNYSTINDTLTFITKQTDTEDIIRKQMLQTVKRGLVRFLIDSDTFNQVSVNFPKKKAENATPQKDPWNFWVFNFGFNGNANGESNRSNLNLSGNFRVSRVTEDNKFSFNSYYNQRLNAVKVDSVINKVKVFDYGFNSIYVKSFSDHWSLGGFYRGFHSIYQNIDFSQSLAPALEYSIYPVKEFNHRQLRCIYQTGVRNLDYIEATIFDKSKETLPYHQLTGIFGVTEPWGSFSAEINGYQYLHDLEKYRMSLELDVNWRIMEGLSFRLYGYASQVRNQISLAKSQAESAQILLGGRQLPTTFNYSTSFGINYTFGSINNSIVNPRFSGVD